MVSSQDLDSSGKVTTKGRNIELHALFFSLEADVIGKLVYALVKHSDLLANTQGRCRCSRVDRD